MFEFNKAEKKILDFWKEHKIFEKSLEIREKGKRFVFFEGPPTANGKPGIHHLLARAFKDLYCRYRTMRGYFVLRKAGWDTHGLPVEIEIEKELGFRSKKDIENYGIAKFNRRAKESVWKYQHEWEEMTKKMGFWLDLKHPYVTYEPDYMESVWSLIKKIWDKKLLYRAHRVVPFCVRCGTPLSFHEVAQGYKRVTERSVTLKFPILRHTQDKFSNFPACAEASAGRQFSNKFQIPKNSKIFILAWTTTPWTLPGNVALAVGRDIDYSILESNAAIDRDIQGGEPHLTPGYYIIATDRVPDLIKEGNYFTDKVRHVKGSDLVGLKYEPLFNVKELRSDKSYKVYDADFVATEEGTGVVHTAVMYGEDDYSLGTKVGLPKVHTVNEAGKFINTEKDLNGLYVKDPATEALIIQKLKDRNNFFKAEDYEHDYPFCWRCNSPLLYYAKDSWFIKISALKQKLLANNKKINWVPGHVKEGRFGQWLSEGKDWTFSRERYWGTPLPVWQCEKCGDYKAVGAIEDLEKNRFRKKNRYFILRHGFSTHTYDSKKAQGGLIISTRIEHDIYNLTEKGIGQAKNNAKVFRKLGGLDLIVASPFRRTKQTAEVISKELGGVKYEIDERLKELDHGSMCEGKLEYVCFEGAVKDLDTKYGDGESWKTGRARMMEALGDLDAKYEGKNILIISHRSPLWLLESAALNMCDCESVSKRSLLYLKEGELREIGLKNYPYNEEGCLDLHRPFIDGITLKCPKCRNRMKKVPDLIDAWFDSGSMPYAQWHWPFENKKVFADQYPADFIAEGIDQTRGWFYTLLAISTLLGKDPAYKNVLALGHVLDERGQKMSKSKGNVISPFEILKKFGADAARWYFFTVNLPGEPKLFSAKDVETKLKGFIFTLQNCLRFYELYESEAVAAVKPKISASLDKWIMSRFNGMLAEVTAAMDEYKTTEPARAIEKFVVEDFSNWWLRRSRKRKEALGLLKQMLLDLAKMSAPFTPFLAEDIYMRLRHNKKAEKPSVHLCNWPRVNAKLIDKELEKEMDEVKNIVALGLAQRKEKKIKVRQPLASLLILRASRLASGFEDLIKEELNVKEIKYGGKEQAYDFEITPRLMSEGYARELIRQVQDMRKEAGYKLSEKIYGQWHSDDAELSGAIGDWTTAIKKGALLRELARGPHDNKAYDVEKEFELAPEKRIWVGIKK